jgi:N-acetylglucosamine-6-sulfatase
MRWDAMSCAGHLWFKTTHLDRLAKEGARFTNAFVTTSLCSPSRASLLTGLYANRHRVLNNFTDLPADLANYPQRLREAGYETAYIGKWHMGEQDDRQRPVFDYWMSHKGQGNYWDNEFNINGQRRSVPGYYTTVVTDAAVDWIQGPHKKPWLLILGHKAPHGGPIVPDEKYEHTYDDIVPKKPANFESYRAADGKPAWLEEQFKTWHGAGGPLYNNHDFGKFVRSYFATIASVDDSVGRLYDALKEAGTLDQTLIIFVSDNGFALGEHGRVDKRTMYEESIRVPLLVRFPPLIPQPVVIGGSVLNLDLAPSILDICGAKPLEKIDGRSWKRLLAGDDADWDRPWLYEYNYESEFPYTPNVRGVRSGNWKFVRYPHGEGDDRHKAELYDLQRDPLENRNLASDPKHADTLVRIQVELNKLLKNYPRSLEDLPLDEGIKQTLPRF